MMVDQETVRRQKNWTQRAKRRNWPGIFMGPFRWWKKERLLRRAERLARKGDSTGALDLVERAVQMSPDNVHVLIQKAWFQCDAKRWDEAAASVDAGLRLKPRHGVLHMIRGEILFAKGDYEGARQMFHRSLELSGENLRVEYMLGRAYLALGDTDLASHFFESSVRYDKSLVQSRLLAMAELYLHQKKVC